MSISQAINYSLRGNPRSDLPCIQIQLRLLNAAAHCTSGTWPKTLSRDVIQRTSSLIMLSLFHHTLMMARNSAKVIHRYKPNYSLHVTSHNAFFPQPFLSIDWLLWSKTVSRFANVQAFYLILWVDPWPAACSPLVGVVADTKQVPQL